MKTDTDIAPDFLQFEGGAVAKLSTPMRLAQFEGVPLMDNGALRVGWTGPWPPPERMLVAVGKQTQLTKILEPSEVNVPMEMLMRVAHVTVYRRESYSRLPDNHGSTHVMRGALYRPEEENDGLG